MHCLPSWLSLCQQVTHLKRVSLVAVVPGRVEGGAHEDGVGPAGGVGGGGVLGPPPGGLGEVGGHHRDHGKCSCSKTHSTKCR